MYWLQSFVLSSAGCLAWALGRLLLVGRQDCCAHGSKSLLVDLDGSAAEPSSKEWCSCSSHRPVRRTDPSFQRVIRATIDQVDAAATTVTRRLPERGSPSSELIASYMQLQASVPKKLGSVDVTATMQALEELLGATSNGVESVAFLLAAAPLGSDSADVCRALPSASSQASDGGTRKCQIGKKIETAEDLVALLSARVDLLALQLVKDGAAVATEASHGGFADVVVMASALSCSLLKSYEEPCEYALSSEWHWTAELLRCLSAHVLTAAAYHEFWSEVHHSRYWLQKSVESLESQFSSKAPATRSDGTDAEALIADLRRSTDTYVHWQSRLVGLSERARAVTPLQLRARPLPAGRPAPPGRALVAYETEEVALCEGESLTVLETSASSPLWRVRTALGQETLVPSLVVELTAPDAAALDAALALRQQLLALWTAHVRLLGRRLVALLSSSFTDVVVCASSTATVQDGTSSAPRFRMDEQQQQKFVTVGQLLQRVLQQLGKDGVKCSQLSGLWHALASLVDGETAMLPEGAANSRRKDATPPLLAAHLQSIELLLIRFEDFVAYWNAYNAFVTQQQQSKLIFLAETKQFTHFITTAHYVRFYNVELQSSLANNGDSLALGDPAAVLPAAAAATDGVTGHGDQSNLWRDGAAKHFLHKGPAVDAPKVTCIPPATTSAVAFDQLRCAAYSDSLAELKRSAFDVHEHWLQVTRLLLCQKVHLRNAAAYHEFWHEVQDAKLSLNCLLSKLQAPAGVGAAAAAKPRRERIGSLTAEINDALNEYMLWQSKFDRLSDEARRIIPLNQRVKITAGRPVQGKAMCAYVTGEVSLAENDPLTVLEADAASSPLWLVRTADGREVRLPSVSVQLLGPDSLALDAASRLHAQLAALWVGTARRFGPRVGSLLREALVDVPQRPADGGSSKRRAPAVGSKVLQRLIGLAELLKACCGGDCGLPQKEAAALQDAIGTCSAALSHADAASDAVDGQEPLEEEDASSLEELLLSYQDFCAYYGQYVIDVEALRQPKYITLSNPDAGSLRYVTMAYFPRVYNVTLMGVGAISLLSPTTDGNSGKLEDDSTARLTTVAADEALPDEEMATQGSAHEADEPLLAAQADGQLQQAVAFEPPASVEEAGPPAADDGTADGSGGDGSWAYGQSSSLTEQGEPAGEGDEDGLRGDGKDRNVRRLCVAGVGETESQDGQIGSFEAGSCGQGEEEEVSYFESSAMEQQVSTEGVMESEMEVTTTFVITGVMCNPGAPDEELCSLQEALDRLVIDPQNNQYVIRNGSKVTRLTIGEAMEAGYIKMGPKTERKTAEKIKSAAIITVKTIAERYPYTVKSAVNTKTQATLTEAEAVAAGIIDLTKHTFRDLESNEVMLIGDAVSLHLVDIVYDKNASGVIHEEVSKKFNVHSVLDERRRERVEFQVAVRRGIIEEGTGSYVSSLTGQKLFAAEAIEKGFIEASVVSSNVSNGS